MLFLRTQCVSCSYMHDAEQLAKEVFDSFPRCMARWDLSSQGFAASFMSTATFSSSVPAQKPTDRCLDCSYQLAFAGQLPPHEQTITTRFSLSIFFTSSLVRFFHASLLLLLVLFKLCLHPLLPLLCLMNQPTFPTFFGQAGALLLLSLALHVHRALPLIM